MYEEGKEDVGRKGKNVKLYDNDDNFRFQG